MLAERRIHPRYMMTFPVEVKVDSRAGIETFDCESFNISRTALEIRGDGAVVASFMAQAAFPHVCEVRFRLPDSTEELVVECQLLTHRRLSQHRYQLALLFGEFHGGSQEFLVQYLDDLQSHAISHG